MLLQQNQTKPKQNTYSSEKYVLINLAWYRTMLLHQNQTKPKQNTYSSEKYVSINLA